jgi:AcrR family transcriptional regulator
VAEALLALVNEGVIKPTAEQIAGRAGVSIRSVFRHTADTEALNHTLIELHISRTSDLFDLTTAGNDRDERIAELAAQRRRLYEAITPVRRAVRVHSPFGEVLRARVDEVNDLLRSQLSPHFAPELAGRSAEARDTLLHAVEMTTSWPSWDQLRTDQGLDPAEAEAVVVASLRALLA